MKIVVLDGYSMDKEEAFKNRLSDFGDVVIYDRTAPKDILKRCCDVEIVLTNKVPIDAKTIENLPKLKYIGVLATGFNIVDIEAAKKSGIVVANVPSYCTNSVAQLVFAHILNIAQQAQHYSEEVRSGKWANGDDFFFVDTPVIELYGRKLGILGLGLIGQAVARIAQSFGMEVLANTPKPQDMLPEGIKKVDVDTLFKESDILSIHCPLTKETSKIVNADNLKLMKPSAIIINTSRGGVVNDADLADALNSGTIFAAGLDVLSQEPPKRDNPLLTAQNCYITPHIAWASEAARDRLMDDVVENIKGFVGGNIRNNVAK